MLHNRWKYSLGIVNSHVVIKELLFNEITHNTFFSSNLLPTYCFAIKKSIYIQKLVQKKYSSLNYYYKYKYSFYFVNTFIL